MTILLAILLTFAQPPATAPVEAPPVEPVGITQQQAIAAAFADASAQAIPHQYCYVWNELGRVEMAGLVSDTCNRVLKLPTLRNMVLPAAVHGNHVLRVDVLALAGGDWKEFTKLANNIDATFSGAWRWHEPTGITLKTQRFGKEATVPVFVTAHHLNPPWSHLEPLTQLCTWPGRRHWQAFVDPSGNKRTINRCVIIDADTFVNRLTSTRKDYDGRYYDVVGFSGRTVDSIFKQFGYGNLLSHSRDDQSLLLRRGPTENPGIIRVSDGETGAIGDFAALTYDLKDDNAANPGKDFTLNLLARLNQNDFDASEWFIAKPDELWLSGLSDAKGNLQNEAPPDVAWDYRIAAVAKPRLEAGYMSCFPCHDAKFPGGGVNPFGNDVLTLTKGGADFVGSVEFLQELSATFGADLQAGSVLSRRIRRAAEDHDQATLRATGGVLDFAGVATELHALRQRYRIDRVTAATVLDWLHEPYESGKAVETFQALCPLERVGGDNRIAALRGGGSIDRRAAYQPGFVRDIAVAIQYREGTE